MNTKHTYMAPRAAQDQIAQTSAVLIGSMPVSDKEVDEGLAKRADWDDVWTKGEEE